MLTALLNKKGGSNGKSKQKTQKAFMDKKRHRTDDSGAAGMRMVSVVLFYADVRTDHSIQKLQSGRREGVHLQCAA